MVTEDVLERIIEETWTGPIEREKRLNVLRYESDLQAALYHHLRNRTDSMGEDIVILAGYRPDNRTQIIDLGIEVGGPGSLRVALEIKGIHQAWTAKALGDFQKLKEYRSLGIKRAYFCYTSSETSEPDRVRRKLQSRLTGWESGYLRVAEGYPQTEERFRIIRY